MDYLYEAKINFYEAKINYERSQGDLTDPTLERLLSALASVCALIAIADEMRKIRMIMEMKKEA